MSLPDVGTGGGCRMAENRVGAWVSRAGDPVEEATTLAWLVLCGVAYAALFVLRYGALWVEGDTAAFSSTVTQVLSAGSVFSPLDYNHGFAYQAWLGMFTAVSGVPAPIMNTVVAPFIGALLTVVMGYLAFRELTRSRWATAVGVLFMLAVPDVMFTVLRGNHEKLNVAFILAALYALLRVYRLARDDSSAARVLPWMLAFYALVLANAMTNDYFGSSFATALSLTFVGMWVLLRRVSIVDLNAAQQQRFLGRLGIAVMGSWLLAWLFMIYIYPPAGAADLPLLHSAVARVMALFATFQPRSNPYTQAAAMWSSNTIYTVLSIFRWVLFLGSLAAWGERVWASFVKKTPTTWADLLMIALYTAFAALVAVSIPIDLAGLAAGSNLEVRNFTYFALVAAPLMAGGVERLVHRGTWSRVMTARRRKLSVTIGGVLAVLLLASTLKADLDPTLSNLWLFYHPGEMQAISTFWNKSHAQFLWTGPDDRLSDAAGSWYVTDPRNNVIEGTFSNRLTRDFLVSPTIRADIQAYRVLPPWTSLRTMDLVYDNGSAEIYRTVPVTAFQR